MDYDDKLDILNFETHIIACLHSDGFCKPTLKCPYNIVWLPDKICLIHHIFDFIGKMSKLHNHYWLRTDDFFKRTGKKTKKLSKASHQLFFLILFYQLELLSRHCTVHWSNYKTVFRLHYRLSCNNNPQNVIALDLDTDEHYVLTPKPVTWATTRFFETKEVQSAISSFILMHKKLEFNPKLFQQLSEPCFLHDTFLYHTEAFGRRYVIWRFSYIWKTFNWFLLSS